jgi:hypothetical protein
MAAIFYTKLPVRNIDKYNHIKRYEDVGFALESITKIMRWIEERRSELEVCEKSKELDMFDDGYSEILRGLTKCTDTLPVLAPLWDGEGTRAPHAVALGPPKAAHKRRPSEIEKKSKEESETAAPGGSWRALLAYRAAQGKRAAPAGEGAEEESGDTGGP